ncbi:AAA family ATPase [Oceanivirga miroungae]|uniref:AAA-ATPase-like domain-containing protein n=1 Tax=Oceanivirga miroungae TaxID=1130046 RepID=A0A6I8MAG4_9FUSO|nr:AAA family ATPase [Oceanivirga miroungae]VWL85162.1 hypothetical protein OMES3154_00446 [Oceanivirga miroungae]
MEIGFSTSFRIEDVSKDIFYIDKTMIIDKLIYDNGARKTETLLICRPRRFGKTLALETIKYFFDPNTKDTAIEFFKDKKIAKTEKFKYLGTRPVIHMSFANDVSGSLETFYAKIYDKMYKLLRVEKINSKDNLLIEDLDEIINNPKDISTLENSLSILIEAVYKNTGIKPILLIDEYDSYVIDILDNPDLAKVLNFYRAFFGKALKNNPNLHFAVLVGVTELTKNSVFSALNNVKISNILDSEELGFKDLFGFTEEELDPYLEKLDLMSEKQRLKEFYDGYNIGNTELYNPASITSALEILSVNKKGHLTNYWVSTGSNKIIEQIFKNYYVSDELILELNELIAGNSVEVGIDKEFNIKNLKSKDAFYTFLLYAGYLTVDKIINNEIVRVRIPNSEVKSALVSASRKLFDKPEYKELKELKEAVVDFDLENISTTLSSLLKKVYSYDIKTNENAYRTAIASAITLTGVYEVKSNINAGLGRSDLVLIPRYYDKDPKIIEMKIAKNAEERDKKHKEAQEQIKDRKYQDYFDKEVSLYSLVCCNYDVSIKKI